MIQKILESLLCPTLRRKDASAKELTVLRRNSVRFIVSSFANMAAIWSQLLPRRKPIEINRTFSRTWLSCGSSKRKEERGLRRAKKRERKKKKRGSRGEARFTGVSRRPPFPCTREFNRGWNVLHLLRVSLLRIAHFHPHRRGHLGNLGCGSQR